MDKSRLVSDSGLWLHTDETVEAIMALRKVSEVMDRVAKEPYEWKWAIMAVDSALTAFMVLALKGGDNVRTMRKRDVPGYVAATDGGEWMEARLDYFDELFAKIQDDAMMQRMLGSQALSPTEEQAKSATGIHKLRNGFAHFTPKGQSMAIPGLPESVGHVMSIIDFLAFDSGNVLWVHDEDPQEVRQLIGDIRAKVEGLAEHYERLTMEAVATERGGSVPQPPEL